MKLVIKLYHVADNTSWVAAKESDFITALIVTDKEEDTLLAAMEELQKYLREYQDGRLSTP